MLQPLPTSDAGSFSLMHTKNSDRWQDGGTKGLGAFEDLTLLTQKLQYVRMGSRALVRGAPNSRMVAFDPCRKSSFFLGLIRQ
jgi:hypothetical protein